MQIFSMDLLEDVKGIKFLNETIGTTRNVICLNFEYVEEEITNNIKILMEEDGSNPIALYVMYENVCKDLDISDSVMENMIEETTKIYKKIREKILQIKYDTEVEIDTMSIENNIYQQYSDEEKTNYIIKLYEEVKPNKRGYDNYVDKLILFGVRGKEVAERIEKLGLGKARKSKGGYLIEFSNLIDNTSSVFTNRFAKGLNEVGISCLSMPLIAIDYFWS